MSDDRKGDGVALQLVECDQASILWRNPAGSLPTIVEVIHETAMPRFIAQFRAAFDVLAKFRWDMEQEQLGIETEQKSINWAVENAKGK